MNRQPATNCSDAVFFLLKSAQKRRSFSVAKAKMIQNEVGVAPRLVALK